MALFWKAGNKRGFFFLMQQPPTDFDLFRSFLGGNRGRKMGYSSPDLSSETFF